VLEIARRIVLLLSAPAVAAACSGATSGASPADISGVDASSGSDGGGVGADGSAAAETEGGAPDVTTGDAVIHTAGDGDGDGIDDAQEKVYADTYLPYLSIHPSDGCATHGIAYRVAPHPKEPSRVMMWIDVLYNDDCGTGGHAGDDEMFGVVIDPTRPAPAGILAVRAISHQGTPCEHTTTCGSCPGMSACATGMRDGKAYPAVFPSKDKHGNYVDMATCSGSFVCDFGGCASNPTPDATSKVNVGEPGHPLVHDLTDQGFVTAANGWSHAELLHFDPWKAGKFGGAGDVSKDFVDVAFVVDTTKCR
jgi:hypothetical protein